MNKWLPMVSNMYYISSWSITFNDVAGVDEMIIGKVKKARTELVGIVVCTDKVRKSEKKETGGGDLAAVLHNANRTGAGFETMKPLSLKDSVIIKMAFLDKYGGKGEEALGGRVQWVRNHTSKGTKGFLLGITWDSMPTKETTPLLYDYLDITIRSY